LRYVVRERALLAGRVDGVPIRSRNADGDLWWFQEPDLIRADRDGDFLTEDVAAHRRWTNLKAQCPDAHMINKAPSRSAGKIKRVPELSGL